MGKSNLEPEKKIASHEQKVSPEAIRDPQSIAVVTATFYHTWYQGEPKPDTNADKLRVDLAVRTLLAAKNQLFQIALVDGRSSQEFRDALKRNGINFEEERIVDNFHQRRKILSDSLEPKN